MSFIVRWTLLAACGVAVAACAPALRRVAVDTPNSCFKVERVEEDRVYLRSFGRICLQVIGHEPVDLDPAVSRIRIFADGTFWKEQELPPASGRDSAR